MGKWVFPFLAGKLMSQNFIFFCIYLFVCLLFSTITIVQISTQNSFGKVRFWCWFHVDYLFTTNESREGLDHISVLKTWNVRKAFVLRELDVNVNRNSCISIDNHFPNIVKGHSSYIPILRSRWFVPVAVISWKKKMYKRPAVANFTVSLKGPSLGSQGNPSCWTLVGVCNILHSWAEKSHVEIPVEIDWLLCFCN